MSFAEPTGDLCGSLPLLVISQSERSGTFLTTTCPLGFCPVQGQELPLWSLRVPPSAGSPMVPQPCGLALFQESLLEVWGVPGCAADAAWPRLQLPPSKPSNGSRGAAGGAGRGHGRGQERQRRALRQAGPEALQPRPGEGTEVPPTLKSQLSLDLSFFPTTVLPGWPKQHSSAPLGAPRVGIWAFLGQCHRCSMALEDDISQSSPRYFGFSIGGGFSIQNTLQRLWGAVGWWHRLPGLAGTEGARQDPAWLVVPGMSVRSAGAAGSEGEGLRKPHERGNSQLLWGTLGEPLSFPPPKNVVVTPVLGVTQKPLSNPHPPRLPGRGLVLNLAFPRLSHPGPGSGCFLHTADLPPSRSWPLPRGPNLFLDIPNLPLTQPQPLPGHSKAPCSQPWPLPVGVKLFGDTRKLPLAWPQPLPGGFSLFLDTLNFPPSGFSHFPEGHPLPGHPKTLPRELHLFLDTPNFPHPAQALSSPSASDPTHPPHGIPCAPQLELRVIWGAQDCTCRV